MRNLSSRQPSRQKNSCTLIKDRQGNCGEEQEKPYSVTVHSYAKQHAQNLSAKLSLVVNSSIKYTMYQRKLSYKIMKHAEKIFTQNSANYSKILSLRRQDFVTFCGLLFSGKAVMLIHTESILQRRCHSGILMQF